MPGPKGPVDRSKKIMEKNAAKGQNSLTRYLGSQTYHGISSNQAAFTHYAVSSNTYHNVPVKQKLEGQKAELDEDSEAPAGEGRA